MTLLKAMELQLFFKNCNFVTVCKNKTTKETYENPILEITLYI